MDPALPLRNDGVTIVCERCGQPFAPSGRRRFCSTACRQAAWRRRRPTRRRWSPSAPPAPPPSTNARPVKLASSVSSGARTAESSAAASGPAGSALTATSPWRSPICSLPMKGGEIAPTPGTADQGLPRSVLAPATRQRQPACRTTVLPGVVNFWALAVVNFSVHEHILDEPRLKGHPVPPDTSLAIVEAHSLGRLLVWSASCFLCHVAPSVLRSRASSASEPRLQHQTRPHWMLDPGQDSGRNHRQGQGLCVNHVRHTEPSVATSRGQYALRGQGASLDHSLDRCGMTRGWFADGAWWLGRREIQDPRAQGEKKDDRGGEAPIPQ